MRLAGIMMSSLVLGLAACGGNGPDEGETEPEATAPTIATDMESPVEDPFCAFTAENTDTSGEGGSYVFVTSMGDAVYHGYAKLDGEVTRLTEVEAGFGAGMETRRYVTEDDSVELEVILLDPRDGQAESEHSGSVRVIYPVEGDAVKFYGECDYDETGE
ncbi:hypothetical protein [Henriciella sp.]|uniref:hypothetical protein n=1 Tax=Henriciella sp. TaxID=1968823 RepID=UPI002631E643|nr:hypothetical protein [Henriciella sp.]